MMIAYDDSTNEYYVIDTQENVRMRVKCNRSSPFYIWDKGQILHYKTLHREYAYSAVYCLLLALQGHRSFSAFVVYYGKRERITMDDHKIVEKTLEINTSQGRNPVDGNIMTRAVSLEGSYSKVDVGYRGSPPIWGGVYFISCYIFFF